MLLPLATFLVLFSPSLQAGPRSSSGDPEALSPQWRAATASALRRTWHVDESLEQLHSGDELGQEPLALSLQSTVPSLDMNAQWLEALPPGDRESVLSSALKPLQTAGGAPVTPTDFYSLPPAQRDLILKAKKMSLELFSKIVESGDERVAAQAMMNLMTPSAGNLESDTRRVMDEAEQTLSETALIDDRKVWPQLERVSQAHATVNDFLDRHRAYFRPWASPVNRGLRGARRRLADRREELRRRAPPGAYGFSETELRRRVEGLSVGFTNRFNEEDVRRFAELSGDRQRAHLDPAFAARSVLFKGGRPVHGWLSSSGITAALGMKLADALASRLNLSADDLVIAFVRADVSFKKPVYFDEEVETTVSFKELRRGGQFMVFNVSGKTADKLVFSGETTISLEPLKPVASE